MIRLDEEYNILDNLEAWCGNARFLSLYVCMESSRWRCTKAPRLTGALTAGQDSQSHQTLVY